MLQARATSDDKIKLELSSRTMPENYLPHRFTNPKMTSLFSRIRGKSSMPYCTDIPFFILSKNIAGTVITLVQKHFHINNVTYLAHQ